MTELKTLRTQKKLTQKEVANQLGISLRSYITYENDERKIDTIKYKYILQELNKLNYIDEEHGLLTIEGIQEICESIVERYPVDFCYLFGSYAKNCPTEISDVDLLISTSLKGLDYVGLIEELRQALHKKVDLLEVHQIKDNPELIREILYEGIRIYKKEKKN